LGSGDLQLQRLGPPTAGFAVNPTTATYEPIDFAASFYPFGNNWQLPCFYLAIGQPLDKPASQVQIEIDVAFDQGVGGFGGSSTPPADRFQAQIAVPPPPPSGGSSITFTWEYWNDSGIWAALPGTSFQPARGAGDGGVFLSSGTLRFAQPADWSTGKVNGASGFWIRARITMPFQQTSIQGSPPPLPPKVTRVAGGFSWLLPRVDLATLSLTVTGGGLLPALGFGNQAPLDLSKDFFPFGEKPRIGDTFYLSSEEAFAKPGAQVTLTVKLTNPANSQAQPLPALPRGVVLSWEYWDGQQWQPLTVNDQTAAFSSDNKTITFTCPPAAPVTVGGKTGHFLRVRIAAGNYGVEATYTQVWTGSPPVLSYQLNPATFQPPSIQSIRLGYSYTPPAAPAEHLVTENDFVFAEQPAPAAGKLFTPFQPAQDDRPTLYLGFDRPGDTAGFANRLTTLYIGVSPGLYDPAAEPRTVGEEAVVVWEYWNGSLWQRLGTRDETQGLYRRGLVTFLGPADFRASSDFGRQAFWLRARWERGDFPLPPRLARILLNTMWADHARTLAGEILGSGRGERGQTFATSQTPVLPGQRLEVVEPEIPSAGERAELEAEEGEEALAVVPVAPGQPTEVRIRWHEVPDFYGSGPRSRHYTLNRATGAVTFGDGQRGLPPPPGRGNVRMAFYRAGGGLAGNRPAGNIVKLKGTVPYIKSVAQPEPAEGGADPEAIDEVRVRGPRTLRHRDRTAAPVDFEDLALAASTAVARARCLPAHDGSDAGRVGLVIVRRSPMPKPVPDVELLNEVQDYVSARLSPVVDLWVVGPDWLEITVSAEIVPITLEAATDVQNAVLDRLTAFLHPLTGGDGTGWDFGRQPHRSDLYALIGSTPGVDHVSWLDVSAVADEGIARPERFLIYSGDHAITLTGSTDGGLA
jgi:predicted phage baseplate assembly protein